MDKPTIFSPELLAQWTPSQAYCVQDEQFGEAIDILRHAKEWCEDHGTIEGAEILREREMAIRAEREAAYQHMVATLKERI